MKSIKIFATVGAIALLGTAGFTSCNQNNTPVGPENYNGEVVKTQFTISIPEAGNANAAAAPGIYRMPATNTQDAGNFLGMDYIVLMPFAITTASADITTSDTRLGSNIVLTSLPTTQGGGAVTSLSGNTNYKVYTDVNIPLGTNHFLFYAHGTTTENPSTDKKFEEGLLSVSGIDNKNPSGISFNLVSIPTDDSEGQKIATYLTGIATAKVSDTEGNRWYDYPNAGIQKLYTEFVKLEAGSATSVLKTVEDLYNSLELFNESCKSTNGSYDAVITAVMNAILGSATAADQVIEIADGGTAGHRTLGWKTTTSYKDYPCPNFPDGAAAVHWYDADLTEHLASAGYPKFDVVTTLNYNTFGVSNPASYVYPACIYYYSNSGLKTSTQTQSSHYNDYTTWDALLAGLYDNVTFVSASTRSVAIEKQIQYGVARLKTAVKTSAATIPDYRGSHATPAPVANVNAADLEMTAVLVGGQKGVGFNFVPAAGAGTQIVYDWKLPTDGTWTLSNTSLTSYNPTLLLETNADQAIRVAVEFVNNGNDFYGENDMLIPTGTKFYVVGELNNTSTRREGSTRSKVFEQDYTTTAEFTLSSLQHAYNVVPDLRTVGMELGFSVDLTWESGNIYDIPIN